MSAVNQSKTEAVIIFDFDGTIADSFLAMLQVVYRIDHGKPLPDEDISRLRGMTMYQLSRVLKVPFWQIPFLIRKTRRLMKKKLNSVNIVPGMDDAIRTLSAKHKLFVLSANGVIGMRDFLGRYGIEACFVDIVGDVSPIHKDHQILRLIHAYNLRLEQCWYIGDETLDIEAAKRVNLKMVAVSWGYSNIHMLEKYHPDKLVFNPEELVTLF